jgi:ABC-type Fe3+/spermidine/putrescine transport system ATPase subunit/ABC-type sulfate transport system permease component
MTRRRPAGQPLLWLAILLAGYLAAPLVAGVREIGAADWSSVDWRSLGASIGVSVASATAAAALIAAGGIPLGYYLARTSAGWVAGLGFLVQLPLALPPLVSGILLLFLLGPYSELGRLANGALTDSFVGIVLAQTFVAAPFLIVAARSAFAAIDPQLEDVAATLGHRALSRFFRVCLPLARPGIGAGLLLAWLRAFGEFGATMMVAYHPYSLPIYTYVAFGGQGLPAMLPVLLPTLAIALSVFVFASGGARDRASSASPPLLEATPSLVPALRPSADVGVETLALRLQKTLGDFTLDIAWTPAVRRLAILGASGSGKSLTLRLVAGLETASTARLELGGEALDAKPPEARDIAYVPQDYGLFPHMTVAEQLAFPVHADASAGRYWLEHLGLADLVDRRPSELSLGQQQRVALARALARPSRLVLLDEPFAALDTPRRRSLRGLFRQLQYEIAATTILVTHDPDEAAMLADEIMVLDNGRVLQSGPTDDLFARPVSLRVAELLGLDNVGRGVVEPGGGIAIAPGLRIAAPGAKMPVGSDVLWRVAPSGLVAAADGSLNAVVEELFSRGGEQLVTYRMGPWRLTGKVGDVRLQVGESRRLRIVAGAVRAWSPAPQLHDPEATSGTPR